MEQDEHFEDELFTVIEKATNVKREEIESNRRSAEIAEARAIAIYILLRKGFYAKQISKICSISKRWIRYVDSSFSTEINYRPQLKCNYKRVVNYLSTKYQSFVKNLPKILKLIICIGIFN